MTVVSLICPGLAHFLTEAGALLLKERRVELLTKLGTGREEVRMVAEEK